MRLGEWSAEMSDMTKERRGEIAYALLKEKMLREGVKLSSNMPREIGQLTKATDIPSEELKAFFLDLLPEVIGDAFGYSHVSLVTKGSMTPEQVHG